MAEDSTTAATASTTVPVGLAPTAGIVKDHIYITEGGELRTIALSQTLPEAMARPGSWRVEDFDLHKELYRGKTSLLYMATDRRSGVQVALKLYRKRKLSTLNRYQVEREIRIHIQLDHVNIVKLYAAFEDEKNVYMVQEFAGGGDLFEDLKRNGGSIKEKYTVRDIIVPFLNALQYLHGLGIIHRDIKPENILLTSQRVIKIADFGLSISYTQERPVTRAGTLDYMAPEVLICPDKRRPEENKDKVLLAYTAQVDAWAVGILCYELMVGYPPFEQESRAATYEHIMYKEPKFPAWMSDDAKKFITVALCKNATQRPTIMDLGQQALILTYAKPVDKPLSQKAPQEFLVERSARSVVIPSSPPASLHTHTSKEQQYDAAPVSPTRYGNTPPSPTRTGAVQAHVHAPGNGLLANIAPVGVKRPVAMDAADECGSTGSMERPKSLSPAGKQDGKVKVASGKQASVGGSSVGGSSMVIDEDASYSIADFATSDDASYFGISQTSPTHKQQNASPAPPITRNPSVTRPPGSPLTKSRLSGVSQPGVAPLSMPQGKVSPLVRGSHANPPAANGMPSSSSEQLIVEVSSGSYYKPQNGILSDDSQVPVPRTASLSGCALHHPRPPGSSLSSNGVKPGGLLMERPALDKLMATTSDEHLQHTSTTSPDEQTGSKYSKLFAKMWGGKGSEPPKTPDTGLLSSSAKSGGSLSSTGSIARKGAMRNLQEELLAERADSIVAMDGRTGSILGAPTMNFKKPSPAAIQARTADAAAAAAAATDKPDKIKEHRAVLLNNPRAAALSDEAGAGPQRMNSDALLSRVGLTGGSGRSFTSANSPAMKKLANAPIVNKIHEYVAHNTQTAAESPIHL